MNREQSMQLHGREQAYLSQSPCPVNRGALPYPAGDEEMHVGDFRFQFNHHFSGLELDPLSHIRDIR